MVRQKLKESGIGLSSFKIRGAANTRIEALSDGVFAIAIALLLISSSVPETYDELILFLVDCIPFGATIAILMTIWFEHYTFFLRYGLTDATTVFLNSLLLFLILLFVYPLKFLFKVLYDLFAALITRDYDQLNILFTETIPFSSTTTLMVIYGLGAVGIFGCFILLHAYALRLKDQLELTELEVFETRGRMVLNLVSMSIPLLSVLIAASQLGGQRWAFIISGWTYFLYPMFMPIYSRIYKKKRDRFVEKNP